MNSVKLKIAIFSVLFFSAKISFSQNSPCQLLEILLKDEYCRKTFQLSSHKGTIVFLDSKKYFTNCLFDSAYQRRVLLTHDSSVEATNLSNIYIVKLSRRGLVYQVNFYQRLTQASGYLIYKKKGRNYIITKRAIGNF